MQIIYPSSEGDNWIVDYSVVSPRDSSAEPPINPEIEIHSVEDEDGNEQAINEKERNKIIEFIQTYN